MLQSTSILTRLLAGLTLAISIGSCSNRDWNLLEERDVRRILPRYAMLAAGIESRGEVDSVRQAAYRQFFEAEGYTLRDWDSSMMWYAKNNIPLYYDFYRLAGVSLNKDAEQLQKRVDSISKAEEYRRNLIGYVLDSINLLNIPITYYRSGDLVNARFNIQPTTPYSGVQGHLSISLAGLPQLSDDKAWDLELRFYAQDSTLQVERKQIKSSGAYSLSLATLADKPVVRIAGHLRGIVPKLKQGNFVFMDSLRFVRYPSKTSESNEQAELSDIPTEEPSTEEPTPSEADL